MITLRAADTFDRATLCVRVCHHTGGVCAAGTALSAHLLALDGLHDARWRERAFMLLTRRFCTYPAGVAAALAP
jgi:hypothetical protein